ncbi:unnamed protein product [Dibothriocephalus latus]|uniref:Uncharacterized protein n=1 Tax=Dibothriocephalus latus TaxID=60516 RepID=A0A3P6SV71_DIBLA|nr:unnamed protein product [Dibothriocephalus latus]
MEQLTGVSHEMWWQEPIPKGSNEAVVVPLYKLTNIYTSEVTNIAISFGVQGQYESTINTELNSKTHRGSFLLKNTGNIRSIGSRDFLHKRRADSEYIVEPGNKDQVKDRAK